MQLIRSSCVLISLAALLATSIASAQIRTDSVDNLRTAWDQEQMFLTPQAVQNIAFGRRYSVAIVGQVHAQPLVANGTLLVGTEDNWLYGIDPDSGLKRWSRQLATPWNASDIGCGQISPRIGITGTPVIDESTNTAYLVSMSYASGSTGPATFSLHAVDIISGTERRGWPVLLQGSAQNAPSKTFVATNQAQRPGLLLLDGVIYAGFGSHCDRTPYQGWIFGVATNGQIKARWTAPVTAGKSGASLWQSGSGLVSDGSTRILFATANGGAPTVPTAGSTPPGDIGESVVRLAVQADGSLLAQDFFAPLNAPTLDVADNDLGSGGPVGLPSPYFGTATFPHLLIVGGKEGWLYLLNRDRLGGFRQGAAAGDDILSRYGKFNGIFGRVAVWPGDGGYVYLAAEWDSVRCFQYRVTGDTPALAQVALTPQSFNFGSGSPLVTSNGTVPGSALVWMISATGMLYAWDALPQGSSLILRYSSSVGTASKFLAPTAGRNMVFVGTSDGHVLAYGAPVVTLTVTKNAPAGAVKFVWSGGITPYTLRRTTTPQFKSGVTTLVDRQSQTSFEDPSLNDRQNYFYLVN